MTKLVLTMSPSLSKSYLSEGARSCPGDGATVSRPQLGYPGQGMDKSVVSDAAAAGSITVTFSNKLKKAMSFFSYCYNINTT